MVFHRFPHFCPGFVGAPSPRAPRRSGSATADPAHRAESRGGRDGQGGDARGDHGAALPAGLEAGDPRSGRASAWDGWCGERGAPVTVSSRSVGEHKILYFTFGLMNGGYIELVFVGIINQQTYLGGGTTLYDELSYV